MDEWEAGVGETDGMGELWEGWRERPREKVGCGTIVIVWNREGRKGRGPDARRDSEEGKE